LREGSSASIRARASGKREFQLFAHREKYLLAYILLPDNAYPISCDDRRRIDQNHL